ncbi:hypothetical protein SAMN04487948_1243 [Halogranum amylolyticum]|uniref:Uncharacterized protein n=1 Tax=Halogranum amylolyticum TaxID=660520 RepID=A0A1H8W5Q8_9EURY|nr:hypothetical protein [Halogranum amylolyticum]SEP22939.1 hypothetical protein SAMN04487948_1243 [Halogranum amylolyticum]
MVRTLKTARQDVYKRLVENDENDDAIFKYNYELFSLGAIFGFFHGDRKTDYEGWSQDFVNTADISNDEHRQTIDLVYQLVKIETGEVEETAVWTAVLEYADRGVELIDESVTTQEDFDLVGIVQGAQPEEWETRLINSVGDPNELEGVRSRS